jgi:hypothetical protein
LHYLTFDAFGQVTADLEFDPAVGSVVDIKQGPGGEIYYCELIAGEVRRYAYDAGNPTAVDDRAYVDQSGAVAIDVLANDIGVLNPATVTQVDPPSFGSLAIATDGVITYTHGGVGLEEDSFSYTVDDSDGDTSNVAVVSVRVLDGNCALVIDGLALHLRSDNGVGLSGSDVVTWADQSGLDNDLSVAGGAPQWVANAFGQLPAVRFDGLDDALGLASPSGLSVGAADRSVFLVAEYRSTGWGGFAYGTAAANQAFGVGVAPDGFLTVRGFLNPLEFVSSAPGTGAGLLVQSATVSAGALRHYRDGILIDSRTHAFNTAASLLRLGSSLDEADHVDMDVAELLVYNRALSETERQTVEDYLQIKYVAGACDNLAPHATPGRSGRRTGCGDRDRRAGERRGCGRTARARDGDDCRSTGPRRGTQRKPDHRSGDLHSRRLIHLQRQLHLSGGGRRRRDLERGGGRIGHSQRRLQHQRHSRCRRIGS